MRLNILSKNQMYQATKEKEDWANFICNYSGYADYDDSDWKRFSYIFGQLRKSAGKRPILIVLIPRPGDFLYMRQGKPLKLQRDLEALVSQYPNTSMIDLLPVLAEPEDWTRYYQICDGHWTPLANRLAANEIAAAQFYQALQAFYLNRVKTTQNQ